MANGFTDDGTGPQTNNDGRPTNRPQTRAATLTGGTGGGAPRGTSPVRPRKPFTGAPFIPAPPPKA